MSDQLENPGWWTQRASAAFDWLFVDEQLQEEQRLNEANRVLLAREVAAGLRTPQQAAEQLSRFETNSEGEVFREFGQAISDQANSITSGSRSLVNRVFGFAFGLLPGWLWAVGLVGLAVWLFTWLGGWAFVKGKLAK
jgi:hypothetical protein